MFNLIGSAQIRSTEQVNPCPKETSFTKSKDFSHRSLSSSPNSKLQKGCTKIKRREVMAIQEDTSAERRKSIDATDELATINLENMQNNTKVINYCRTFMSIIGGVIAGILGFTGLTGFVFYFIVMAITSVGLAAKAEFSVHSYFDSWNRIALDGFLGGLMSFVLFWTFAYDFVHIF